jgi:murein DD-endopeptidase MepM/ murein hydrolase activator NlpD
MMRNALRSSSALLYIPFVALLIAAPAAAQTPDALDQAVAARLTEHAQGGVYSYRALGRTVDLDSAGVVYLEHIDAESGEALSGLIDLALVALQEGAWQVRLPGDPAYTSTYDLIPPNILSEIDARPYKPAADPALVDARSLRSYRYPWTTGQWATVTRSFNRHGLGQIDFDLGAREVAAMRDGVIVYADDSRTTNGYDEGAWWYWNTVIIEHAPHEYALYGHLDAESIPTWIRDACPALPDCSVPISAGEVIGLEGSTGYSSNPHLHVEFGQAWGTAHYRDTKDDDRDDDRRETVQAPYMYAEQNAGFRGFTASEVAAWQYGTVLQAYHGAPAPSGQNIVENGDFVAETRGWSASGQISWAGRDGVLRVFRLNTTDPPAWASFYQNLDYGADANTPFEVQLQLANDSDGGKTASVMLRNAAGAHYGALACDFALPPRSGWGTFTLRGATNATWGLLRLEVFVNPPDSLSAMLADNISVQRRPDLSVSGVECG